MFTIPELSVAVVAIALAYIIFSLTGFGSALVAAPLLAHVMPVPIVIPLLAVLDFVASALRGIHLNKEIARDEIVVLIPAMLVGNAIGATLIFTLSPRILAVVLGVFVSAYAIYALSGFQSLQPISRSRAASYGIVGGACSAMFGSGGFLYALYLNKRLSSTQTIRATQSAIINLSTFIRVIIFAFTSVYYSRVFWMWVLFLAPAMFLGEYLGYRISRHLLIHRFRMILHSFLLLSGASLILRYWLSASH